MIKFEIYKDKRDEFRFNLRAGNGKTILSSEGYKAKAGCYKGVNSVKENSKDDSRFERLKSKSDKPYFNLKAKNGKVIGTSGMYPSKSSMEKEITCLKNNAPDSKTENLI